MWREPSYAHSSALSGYYEERRVRAVMIEVSDNTLEAFGDSASDLMLALGDYGFRTYVVRDNQLRPFRIAGESRELSNVVGLLV